MKQKEGRDFLSLTDCVASKQPDGAVRLSNMCESFTLSADEWKKLVKFVATAKPENPADPA